MKDLGYENVGCSDGNCVVKKREGMHTNGGCKCVHGLWYGLGTLSEEASRTLHEREQQLRSLVWTLRCEIDRLKSLTSEES